MSQGFFGGIGGGGVGAGRKAGGGGDGEQRVNRGRQVRTGGDTHVA